MTITAILFDLDDTLIADEEATRASFMAAWADAGAPDVDPWAVYHAARRLANELWRAAPTFPYCDRIGISAAEGLWGYFRGSDPALQALYERAPAYRRAAWTRALAEQGIDDEPRGARLADVFQVERHRRHIVFPDVEDCLRALRRDHKLALVTNGAPDLQREKYDATSLPTYFDVTIVSGEVGIGKPDGRIFDLALERLGADRTETLMVGDNPGRDIVGAQGAGIKGIWIKRPGVDRDLGTVVPDATITDLHALRRLL